MQCDWCSYREGDLGRETYAQREGDAQKHSMSTTLGWVGANHL